MTLEHQFRADLAAWQGLPEQPGKWFGPSCACIEYSRQRLAEGTFAEPALKKDWDNFKARNHRAMVDKWITGYDLVENKTEQTPLQTARDRCWQTLQGLIATIDAAALIVDQGWQAGLSLPDAIRDRLTTAIAAYQSAWGLAPGGRKLPLLSRKLQGLSPIALEAMFEVVREHGIDSETAPAWLAVHRLLDYLLTGAAAAVVAAVAPQQLSASPTPPHPQPGSPENPVLVRVLLASQRSAVGQMHDLFAIRQDEGPASWYLDPVQFGLTAFQPDFIDSLRLAWLACQANQTPSAAIRLAPALVDCKILDGPSAGAVAACAMYAALVGEQLNADASASAALKLRHGRSLDDRQTIRLEDIVLGDVGFIREKLGAAHQGRKKPSRLGPLAAPLRKVVFTEAQARDAIEAKWHQPKSGPAIAVKGAENLGEVYTHLTGHARIERVLGEYARQMLAEWEQAWTDPDSERGSLLYYVAPAYRLFDRQTGKRAVELFVQLHEAATGDDGDHQLQHEDIDLSDEDEALVELWHKGGELLCLSEGPGAGKTTFTRRLLAFLCGGRAQSELAGNGPLVALRWEESAESADEEWPTDFPAAIARRLESACRECGHGTEPADVAGYALEHGTVVLILDALDQAAPERVKGFHEFLKRLRREKQWHVRVVLTGRTYAVDAIKQKLATVGDWRFGAVLPFDRRRQHAYFYGPVPAANPADPSVPRSFKESHVRRLVRELPANSDEDDLLSALSELVPFYAEVAELFGNPNTLFMVRRLAEEGKLGAFQTRAGLYCQTSGFLLAGAARKLRKWPTDARPVDDLEHPVVLADIQRWESLLAAAAFTMMTIRPGHFRVSNQVDIADLRNAAAARLEKRPTDDEWQLIERIAQLTNRSLLYASTEQVWAWPDRRMMEFYCGLHLARNSQPGWVRDQGEAHGPPACGDPAVRANAANPEWREAFRFALELPARARNDRVLLASVAEVYQPVAQRELKKDETPWSRPTELMYRAWCLLEDSPAHERAWRSPQLLKGGGRVLAAFRDQFQRQLADQGEIGRIARELDSGFETVPALVNESLALTELQRISLDTFLLGRTAVTRAQYGLFDPAYALVNAKLFDGYEDKSPRCPAGNLTWYDGWCAARYFGGRLPTEAEWEYACAAGARTRFCRTQSGEDLESEEELRRVADFGRPWKKGPREVDVGADLADGTRRKLEPNTFGLIGMHGGVWEWCVSWYGEFSPTEPAGPAHGSRRVYRGGSWDDGAGSRPPSDRSDERARSGSPQPGVQRVLPLVALNGAIALARCEM